MNTNVLQMFCISIEFHLNTYNVFGEGIFACLTSNNQSSSKTADVAYYATEAQCLQSGYLVSAVRYSILQ